MGIFGEGYRYHVTGLIHDIRGFPTLRQDEIEPFLTRLFRKISSHFGDIQMVERYQVEDADLVIIAYGCIARSAHRAMVEARAQGLKVGLLKLITIWPFPAPVHRAADQGREDPPGAGDEHGPDLQGSEAGERGGQPGAHSEQDRRHDHQSQGDPGRDKGEDMIEDRPLIYKYLRHDKKFPHVWCGGCGIGILLGSLIRAIDHLGYTKDEIVLVSGIGCSGRLPVYVDFNTLHTTHGRALTFATGAKLAKPELKVIVVMGDGDATAIGGNHFIHAARRNVDVTAIIVNNSIYGMTGGQYSPTTPYGQRATTATYGSVENSFNISQLAVCAGAVFVARGTVYHTRQLDQLIERALQKKGFSVVEVISQCQTHYGRLNKLGNQVEMMKWQRDSAVPVEKAKTLSPEEMAGKFEIGILVDREAPTYHEEYARIREKAKQAMIPPVEKEEKEETDRREASDRH